MVKLGPNRASPNVNVTLGQIPEALKALQGKELPCILCGEGLPILFTKRNKPYCVCNNCGIQVFFRGKPGIVRLRNMAIDGILVSVREQSAAYAILLLNRLERLRLQRKELVQKQGFIIQNPDVEITIRTVDAEIERVQGELDKCAPQSAHNNDTKK
jgi:energy-coupling factor transporter ATP-binding protein EcfA2